MSGTLGRNMVKALVTHEMIALFLGIRRSRKGGNKKCDRVEGKKYGFSKKEQLHETGRRNFWKQITENYNFWQNSAFFLTLRDLFSNKSQKS